MTNSIFQTLPYDITCIDANYVESGTACFYLVESDGEFAIIETGTNHSVANLDACLATKKVAAEQIRYVIPTHVHLDHAGGAGAMMARFPRATLLIHPRGARHMIDPERLVAGSTAVYGETVFSELYGEIVPVAASRVVEVGDADSVNLGTRRLEFRHTEGHARHHFCLWDERSSGWFSGDMFGVSYPWFRFATGDFILPSTTPTQFDPDAYLDSLRILHEYSPQRIYLTHSGAIEYSAAKNALLATQIEDYRRLALRHLHSQDELEAALMEYTVERLCAVADCSSAQAHDWLRMDIALNAQGLIHWLGQQSV